MKQTIASTICSIYFIYAYSLLQLTLCMPRCFIPIYFSLKKKTFTLALCYDCYMTNIPNFILQSKNNKRYIFFNFQIDFVQKLNL